MDKQMVKDMAIFLGLVIGITSVLLYAGYFLDKASCYSKFESFEAVKYSALDGCVIQVNGLWIPQANLVINP